MLKGLALTPPVIGRISIGRVVEKNGKRLPEKDDEFTITSQVQLKDGWVLHPVDEVLRKDTNAKLRSIPVRLLFGDPDLSLRVKYTLFERTTGRPLCVGDGESCRRVTPSGMQSLPCPAPHACALAVGGACKPYGRLHVRIDASGKAGSESGHEVGAMSWGVLCFARRGSTVSARSLHGCITSMLSQEGCWPPCRWSCACGGSPRRCRTGRRSTTWI